MRSLHPMSWSRVAVFGAILSGTLASGAWAQPAGGRPKLEPAPKEVLDAYILAVKQTSEYRWYSALPVDRMKELVAKWQEEFGYKLTPYSRPFWDMPLLRNQPVELADGSAGQLFYHQNLDGRGQALSLNITKYQMGSGGAGPQRIRETYLLRETDFGDLTLRVLISVVVQDPLTAPVERFAAQNEPLSTLFNRLCAMGQASSSYRQDLADKMRITLDLRGKSVLGCLTVLARTAGGQAMVLGSGREPMSVEKVNLGKVVNLEELQMKQAEASATQPASSQPDPVAILRKAVQSEVESMRKDRPVLILQLPVAGE